MQILQERKQTMGKIKESLSRFTKKTINKGKEISETKDVILIDSSSESGKQFIDKCISHFDKLAEIYSDYTELEI